MGLENLIAGACLSKTFACAGGMQIAMPARHRTVRSKGISTDCAGHDLQTRQSRRKSWRRLDGRNQLPKVILGVEFADGIEVIRPQAQAAA